MIIDMDSESDSDNIEGYIEVEINDGIVSDHS